jgi:hypothetical protein
MQGLEDEEQLKEVYKSRIIEVLQERKELVCELPDEKKRSKTASKHCRFDYRI